MLRPSYSPLFSTRLISISKCLPLKFGVSGVRNTFGLSLMAFSLAVSALPKHGKADAYQALYLQSTAVEQNLQEVVALERDRPVERELAGGQKHTYQITLTEGQYVKVEVRSQG